MQDKQTEIKKAQSVEEKISHKNSIVLSEKAEQNSEGKVEKNDEAYDKLQNKRKEDAKSIFLENVDYKSTKEDLISIFEDCGVIARVTICKDNVTKQPKGIAYLSFEDPEDVERALYLTGTKLRGRYIKVNRKRTNIPGMSKTSGEQQQIFFMGEMMKKFGHAAQGGRGMPRGRGKQ